jgi:hypothetical protein
MYNLGFPGDFTGVKFLVYGLFLIDTVQTVCLLPIPYPDAYRD